MHTWLHPGPAKAATSPASQSLSPSFPSRGVNMGVASGLAGPPLPSETSAEPEVVFQVPTKSPTTQDEAGATCFAYIIRIYMIYAFQHGTKPAAQENWFDILRLSLHIYITYIYVHMNLFLFGRRGRPQALAILRQLNVARTLWPSLPRKSKTRRTKYHQSRPHWLLRVPGPGLMAPRPMTLEESWALVALSSIGRMGCRRALRRVSKYIQQSPNPEAFFPSMEWPGLHGAL